MDLEQETYQSLRPLAWKMAEASGAIVFSLWCASTTPPIAWFFDGLAVLEGAVLAVHTVAFVYLSYVWLTCKRRNS